MAEESEIVVLEKNRAGAGKLLSSDIWGPTLRTRCRSGRGPGTRAGRVLAHLRKQNQSRPAKDNCSKLSGVFILVQREDERLSGMLWKALPNSFPEFGKKLDQMSSFQLTALGSLKSSQAAHELSEWWCHFCSKDKS